MYSGHDCLSFKVRQMDLAVFHYIIASNSWKRKIRGRLLLFDCFAHRKSPYSNGYTHVYDGRGR